MLLAVCIAGGFAPAASYGQCSCAAGIGSSAGDVPALQLSVDAGASLAVCGYVESAAGPNRATMSEFEVFDCVSRESLARYGATEIIDVRRHPDRLELARLKRLPVGGDWEWSLVPFSVLTISASGPSPKVGGAEWTLVAPAIDPARIERFHNALRSRQGTALEGAEVEEIIGKLLACSLAGDEDSRNLLLDLEDYLGLTMDGGIAEYHSDALRFLALSDDKGG
jgi:hypothetical protein